MVHEFVRTGDVHLKLHDGCSSCRDKCGLNVLRVAGTSFRVDTVEDLADNMETGDEVRSAVSHKEPDTLPDFGFQRLVTQQGAFSAVKHDIGRMFLDGFFHVEGLMAFLVMRSLGIKIALHHIILTIHWSQSPWRLDQDQSVHAIGAVLPDRRRRAVIYVEPGVDRLERELRTTAGCGVAAGSSAAWGGHRMEVDVMREPAVGMVHEVEFDRIALSHSNEFSGNFSAKGPEAVLDAVGHRQVDLAHL